MTLRSPLRLAAALLATLAFAAPAAATTYSTDYTDLWFNAAEQGWGVNIIQQGNVFFATLFVYDVNGKPAWFVASDVEPSPAGSQTSFTGALYQTSGPYFALGTFNPGAVGANTVGVITFTFTSATTGTMQYTVNGSLVTKSITRQTWRANDLTGNYIGGLTAQATGCSGVSNGPALIFDELHVQQSDTQATLTVNFFDAQGRAAACTFTGLYTQAGQLGALSGSWGCSFSSGAASTSGNYAITEIAAHTTGFSGKFSGADNHCSYSGYFGGVRDVL
jgi:hypothetical protein